MKPDGEGYYWEETGYVGQYDDSKDNWGIYRQDYRGYGTGFRPVLIPADPETLQPDPSRLAGIRDGSLIRMGTLYMDGAALANPTNPIGCGQPQFGMFGPPLGNVSKYVHGATLELGNSAAPEQQISFIKVGDRLVSDRVILGCVSMSDLENHLQLSPCVPARGNEKTPDGPIELWGRLGFCLTVTPEEFDILQGEETAAKDFLIQLIQSDRPVMYGDTYFPEPANQEYLENDLNFELPERPLHVNHQQQNKVNQTCLSTLDSRLSDAHIRSSAEHTASEIVHNDLEH